MLKIFFLIFISIYSLQVTLADSLSAENFKIVIDPGHGGQDLGAVRDSFVESKIVLDISKKVAEQLKNHKFKVLLTREQDKTLSLKDRVQMANQMRADLFISLHANTSAASSLYGVEFYFSTPRKYSLLSKKVKSETNTEVIEKIKEDFKNYQKTEKSLMLSKSIQNFIQTPVEKAVIKQAPFYVIENTSMPSILIELGFISNRREAKKLKSPEYQNEIAKLIAQAIVDYKEKSDKATRL